MPTSTPVEQVVTPTRSGPAVQIGSASGSPGTVVSFDVTLATGGEPIAGVQNDIAFSADAPVAATLENEPDAR